MNIKFYNFISLDDAIKFYFNINNSWIQITIDSKQTKQKIDKKAKSISSRSVFSTID